MNHTQLLAHSLASRVPAMAQDCTINNAWMIEREIARVVDQEVQQREVLLINALLAMDEMLRCRKPLFNHAERNAYELAEHIRKFLIDRIPR